MITVKPLQGNYGYKQLIVNNLLLDFSVFFDFFCIFANMFQQKDNQMGFVDNYVEKRIRKNVFFKRINVLVDWNAIEKEINKVYKRGHSVDGRPAYSGLLLFKMLLLGMWYDLSDEKVEESVNDSLSMMRFCELDIEDKRLLKHRDERIVICNPIEFINNIEI